jgi:hypothetical protein
LEPDDETPTVRARAFRPPTADARAATSSMSVNVKWLDFLTPNKLLSEVASNQEVSPS